MIDPRRIAVYIAGDSNIFFPALVAIDSIQRHNQHLPFDYFMSFEESGLTDQMRFSLTKRNITFVDVDSLGEHGTVDDLPLMGESRWPKHVFYNWLLPNYLHAVGYQYALKVDYDLLCVEMYELSDVRFPDNTMAGLTFDLNLLGEGVAPEHLTDLPDPEHTPYYNAGFVPINLARYVEQDTFGRFKDVYMRIQSGGKKIANAEQAALAIVGTMDPTPIHRLDAAYNQRITLLPALTPKAKPILKNIHYLTHNKPWLPVDFRYLSGYVKIKRTGVYLYRNIWLNYASEIEGFSDFVKVRPHTDLQTIGIMAKVLDAHYRA
jgi:lipopolysaccharide biosynthesis glycosyltransferase